MPGEQNEDGRDGNVSHVSVKPPIFYKRSPQVWFKQMESQFALANVKKSETKYHHVLAALPEDIAINIDLDGDGQYETIKEAVLTSLKPNQHELIDQALRGVELGNKRPTQMVGEIRRRFSDIGLEVEEKIVKSQLLAAMPHTIRSALVGHEKASIDEFASIADSMLSITGSQSSSNPFLIGAVQEEQLCSNRTGQPWRRDHNSGRKFQHDSYFVSNTKFNVKPFYSGQRPRVCNAHIFYGERARSCRHWCRWPNKPQRILKDNEKTPSNSRPSSPASSRLNK